jgi:hypothetical protein
MDEKLFLLLKNANIASKGDRSTYLLHRSPATYPLYHGFTYKTVNHYAGDYNIYISNADLRGI